jgi:hypothetical protein
MAEKRTIVRLSAEGGQTVRAEFASTGQAAQGMGKQIKAAGGDAGLMSVGTQKAIDSLRGIEAQQKSASSSANVFVTAMARETAQFRALKASIDPAYAAQMRYETAVEKVQRAQRLGVASAHEAEATLAELERQYHRTGNGADALAAAQVRGAAGSRAMAAQVQNASYQVGDFFVQVAGGTAASRALAMQLPQLLGGFGMWGAAAGAVAAIMGALLPVLIGGGKEVKSYDDQIRDLSAAIDAYRAAADAARAPTAELTAQYGQAEAAARTFLIALRESAEQKSMTDLALTLETVATKYGGLSTVLQFSAKDARDLGSEMDRTVATITESFAVTTDEAQYLADALAALQASTAGTVTDQNKAAADLVAVLSDIEPATQAGLAAAQALTSEISEAGLKGLELDATVQDVHQSILDAVMAAYDIGSGIASAMPSADTLLIRMREIAGAAWEAAQGIAQAQHAANVAAAVKASEGYTSSGRGSVNPGVADSYIASTGGEFVVYEPAKVKGAKAGGRGRGSGAKRPVISAEEREAEQERNRMGREAERIIASMRTETEKYNDELRDLQELNKLGYFKDAPEAYARAVADLDKQLNEAKFGPMLKGMQEVNGELARAILGSGTLGDVFANQMQRMAESLVTSGLDQLSTALLGPLLGGIGGGFSFGGGGSGGKGLLSFAGGGHTGRSARSGGMDGRGGFLALLHPQERVVDEARGGGAGAMGITVNVTGANGDEHVIALVKEGVSRGLSAFDQQLPSRVKQISNDPRVS